MDIAGAPQDCGLFVRRHRTGEIPCVKPNDCLYIDYPRLPGYPDHGRDERATQVPRSA